MFPVGNAAVDDLDRGVNGGDGSGHLLGGRFRVRQIRGQHEGNLRLGLGLKALGRTEPATIGDAHVIEQRAEIRLIDTELHLHRLGRQPGLAPHDAAALRQPEPGVYLLHRIGACGIGRLQPVAKGAPRPGIGSAQAACEIVVAGGHSGISSKHRTIPPVLALCHWRRGLLSRIMRSGTPC